MKIRIGEFAAWVGCVVAAGAYLLAHNTYALAIFADFGLILYIGVAAAVGVVNYVRIGRSLMANLSLGFAVGLTSLAISLAIYGYATYVTGLGLPYLSWFDVFYLLSYLPMMTAVLGMLTLFRKVVSRKGWLIVLLSGIVLYTLDAIYVIPVSIRDLTTPLDAFVTILYPSLDIALFLLVFPLFFASRAGVFEKAFLFIVLGAALLAVRDIAYAYLSVLNMYYDGHPVDLLVFFGAVSAGYGFWRQHADLSKLTAQ